MPLTDFQRDCLRLLASQRNPESHVGGGVALNRAHDSPRFSADVDIFHDVADAVFQSAAADAAVLVAHGYTVDWLIRQPVLVRAKVGKGSEQLRLDWCHDSAFRFFPVEPDPEFGYCLHRADLATNKMLALAGRSEMRDFLDILYVHQKYLSLGAIIWAACGKDQGFCAWSLLEMAKRHVKFRQEDLASEHLSEPLSLADLKEEWTQAADQAALWFTKLPATEIGCLYLDATGAPITATPGSSAFSSAIRHYGCLRGAWPKLV